MFVPVVDSKNNPLMPTTPARARKWIKSRKATYFWKKGVFCVRLNKEPSARNLQKIAVGIDPGSKKEGFSVKSELHTYLNIQADAEVHVKKAVEDRRIMRRTRRQRKTPCRKNKINRKRGGLPPSTKARWDWKLRICRWLSKIFPIDSFVVEDISASTKKGKRKWNSSFSPLQIGKAYFYAELQKIAGVLTKKGNETKALRDNLGLKKTNQKLSEVFEAHCVDSWVLANWKTGGHAAPDNKEMLFISPIIPRRRELHAKKPDKKGIRRRYGGTRSLGFKRGSLAFHSKKGICYIGGNSGSEISLHDITNGKRLCQNAKPKDLKFLTYSFWKIR